MRFREKLELKKLGDIAKITMGQSPESKFYNKKDVGLPLIQGNADIGKRKTISRIFTSVFPKRGHTGDTIMSVRAPVGEIAKATFDCCLGRGVCAISYANDYIYHYMIFIENSWTTLSTGSTFDSINSKEISNLKLFLPKSKEEQHLIVEILSDTDELIKQVDYLITKKKNIKQGTMQELLTGKKRLKGFEIKQGTKQSELGSIPKDWDIFFLKEKTLKIGSGITPRGGEKVYKKKGRPFIRSQNVGWGNLILGDVAFIDEKTHSSFNSTEIRINDVLLNITGASIGRSTVADSRIENGNVNQHVCIIRTESQQLISYYLNNFLLSNRGLRQIDMFQAGGNREGLNFDQIGSIQILVPTDIEEQLAIIQILSDMDLEIKELESKRDKYIMIKNGTMQKLLTGEIRLV